MSFDEPFRLRVLKALCDSLKVISVANGYKTDLGERVFRGRSLFGDDDALPFLSILEIPVPIDQIPSPEKSTASTGDWDLLVQGFVQDDRDNPTDPAHFLMADVKRVLAQERRRRTGNNSEDIDILGMRGKVTRLDIGPGTVRPPDEISSVAYFWLKVTLKIVEDNLDPYV